MHFTHKIIREIEYSSLELLADVDDELPLEETFELEVTYDVYGESKPATWGYYGGEPAEEPEAEIVDIVAYDESGEEVDLELTTEEENGVIQAAYADLDERAKDPF